jgi:hypothetical protein
MGRTGRSRYFGTELQEGSLVPANPVHLGEIRFSDWLAQGAARSQRSSSQIPRNRKQVAHDGEDAGRARLLVRMEVDGSYPRCRGGGWFAPVGTWLYVQTQARVHHFVMRRFVRSLVRLELSPSRAGRSVPAGLRGS